MKLKLYEPHENQIKIHKSKAKYRVVVAGRRFGKSALGLNEGIARVLQLKRQIVWIILPLYRQAKEIYWIDPDITQYFMPLVQAGVFVANKQELSLYAPSTDSWLRLKGSDSYDSLRGSGIDLIIWDEVADVKEEAFEAIEPALADSPYHRMLYIGTPKGLNHFHDYALRGDREGIFNKFGKTIKAHKDWESWHFTSYDNMSFKPGTKERKLFVEYIDQKRKEAEEKGRLPFWEQEYGASFDESAGRFFPQWLWNTHGYDGSIVPKPELTILESIDWGRSAPFAWYAHVIKPEVFIDPKTLKKTNFNRIYTFAELYGTQKSPQEWSAEIMKMRKKFKYTEPKMMYVDPSMFNPLSDGSSSIVRQMTEGFKSRDAKAVFERGSKNRKSRWSAMDDWMRIAVDGLPYWIVTKDCPNLARTIPLMETKENDIEDLNTDLEDHAVDSVSYLIPFVKWTDSTLGTVARPIRKKTLTRFQNLIDPTIFE
jgi:hypothetical protein